MGYLLNQSTYLALLRATFIFSIFLSVNFFQALPGDVRGGGAEVTLPFIALFFSILIHQVV